MGRGSNLQKKTKNRRDVKTQDAVAAKIVHGAEMMTRQKRNKKWPPRASGETRDLVCGLRGFQDVLWVVATVNVFKLERRVTTWTLIFPPDGSHGSFHPRMAFEALMYKPVSSTYSPTDDGRSQDFRATVKPRYHLQRCCPFLTTSCNNLQNVCRRGWRIPLKPLILYSWGPVHVEESPACVYLCGIFYLFWKMEGILAYREQMLQTLGLFGWRRCFPFNHSENIREVSFMLFGKVGAFVNTDADRKMASWHQTPGITCRDAIVPAWTWPAHDYSSREAIV